MPPTCVSVASASHAITSPWIPPKSWPPPSNASICPARRQNPNAKRVGRNFPGASATFYSRTLNQPQSIVTLKSRVTPISYHDTCIEKDWRRLSRQDCRRPRQDQIYLD